MFKICVDQGFPRNGDDLDVLVGPLSKRSAHALSPILCGYIIRLLNSYFSLCQASEWGMIKKRLPSEKKCKHIIESIMLVHNVRTHFLC